MRMNPSRSFKATDHAYVRFLTFKDKNGHYSHKQRDALAHEPF